MPDESLTPGQAATCLGCSAKTIRSMLRDGLLPGNKVNGQWQVETAAVEELSIILSPAKTPQPSLEVDLGMVEASVALAGIAAAIAAILPGISGAPETFRLMVAILAGILAVFSAYGALWLLACFCNCGESASGLREILTLLTSPSSVKPCYWFMALALLIWLIVSGLIGVLAVMG